MKRHALFLTIATASLASMNANGEVLVSNFFDDDATSRGNLLAGDDQKLDCDTTDWGYQRRMAIQFTVSDRYDYTFERVELEFKLSASFDDVSVTLKE